MHNTKTNSKFAIRPFMILIFFVLLIFLMQNFSVIAAQPYLPTSIYGKVFNQKKGPASGIAVAAVWIDADDVQSTSTTKTLSAQEAQELGDKNLEGSYLFNQGYVKAKLNSQIKIIINGFEFETVNSNPGGMVTLKDSILTPKKSGNSANSGTLGTSGTSSTDTDGQSDDSSSKENNEATQGNNEATQDNSKNSDGNSGSGNENSNTANQDSASNKNSGESGGTNSGAATDNSVPVAAPGSSTSYFGDKAEHSLATNLFGELIDEKGNPLPGQILSAQWTDEFGFNHSATAKTLSAREAKDFGNKDLQGFYSFNKANIKAKPGSTITIKSANSNFTRSVLANPGNTIDLKQSVMYSVNPQKKQVMRSIANRVINETGKIAIESFESGRKNISFIMLLLFLAALTLAFYILRRKKIRKKKFPIEYSLYKEINYLLYKKIKNFMVQDVSVIQKESLAIDALNTIISENRNSLVVVSNEKPVGIISERDFLKKVFAEYRKNKSFAELKVKDIMNSPLIFASADSTVSECIKLAVKNKIRKIPIVKNGKLIGIVTATDLLKIFHEFFSKNIIESFSVPSVRNIINNEISQTTYDARLLDVCEHMMKKNTDYALIVGHNNGIITIKDISEEFYKDPNNLEKLKAGHVMKSPVLFIKPGENIFEANNIMAENSFRRLPVMADKQFVGVLNQIDLLNAIYMFSCDLKARAERVKK